MLHIKGSAVPDTLEAIKARAGKAELDKIISHLDPETRESFQRPISPSSWYSGDAFSRFSRGRHSRDGETNKNW